MNIVHTNALNPLAYSASELATRIRDGDLSPVDVVEAHIARIEATNGALNALVRPTFEQARHEAQVAANSEPVGPLHGVPFTVKDSLAVAGIPATSGLISRSEYRPAQDAPVVARLRQAGAILLGKTNTPDNCWAQETDNPLFGLTKNPLDVMRSVGGSSGGEAAIIAAGGSPLGIGSDIAGSIRLPAAFTGIVGLRPTSGLLAEEGHWPAAEGRLADLESVGPMARRVEDVALAFDVMRGVPPTRRSTTILGGQRVVWWMSDGLLPASPAIQRGIERAVEALQRVGMRASKKVFSAQLFANVGWTAYLGTTEREAIARGFGNGEAWSPAAELTRMLRGAPRVSPGALFYWLFSHYGSTALNWMGIDGAAWRATLRQQFLDLVGKNGIAVCPIFPTTAPPHGWSLATIAPLTLTSYQTWVNLAGLCALVVPVGFNGHGMPVGIQLVAAPYAEDALLAAGAVVQRQRES